MSLAVFPILFVGFSGHLAGLPLVQLPYHDSR